MCPFQDPENGTIGIAERGRERESQTESERGRKSEGEREKERDQTEISFNSDKKHTQNSDHHK